LMAQTAGRCSTKERGSHSVPTLLTKEAERVKQNRVRTILAVLFLAVEKIALHKLPALAKLVFQMGFKTSDDAHTQRSTAPAVGLMSSSKYGLLLLNTAGNRPPIRIGLRLSWCPRATSSRPHRRPGAGSGGERGGRERKMTRSSGSLSGQILGL
jgi:hypothetical protein